MEQPKVTITANPYHENGKFYQTIQQVSRTFQQNGFKVLSPDLNRLERELMKPRKKAIEQSDILYIINTNPIDAFIEEQIQTAEQAETRVFTHEKNGNGQFGHVKELVQFYQRSPKGYLI